MKTVVCILLLSWSLPLLGITQPIKSTNDEESYDFEAIQRNRESVHSVKPVDEPDPFATMTDTLEKLPEPYGLDDFRGRIGYPFMARDAGIEGDVIVRVLVDRHSHYVKHVVLHDPHPILTKAIVDRINQLPYTPGILNGKPVLAWISIRLEFRLWPNYPDALPPKPTDDQWICDALAQHLPFNEPEKLTTLTLRHQELEEFPACMLKFTTLKRLDLSENQIFELSPRMAELQSLEILNLNHNKLQSLPKELLKLPNLKAIYVAGNNFSVDTRSRLEKHYGQILYPKDAAGNVWW